MFRKKTKKDVFDGHLTKQGWSSKRYHRDNSHLTKQKAHFSEEKKDEAMGSGEAGGFPDDENEGIKDFEEVCDYYLNQTDYLIRQISDRDMKAVASNICVRGKQILFYRTGETLNSMKEFLFYYLPVVQELLLSCAEMEKNEIMDEGREICDLLNTIQHSFDTFVEKISCGKMPDVKEDTSSFEMLLERRKR